MNTDERFKLLLSATPAQQAAVDAVLVEQPESKRPVSFRLYRMGEAAELTGLSRTTLWRAIKEGRLSAVEIRKGSNRIHETELMRFVGAA